MWRCKQWEYCPCIAHRFDVLDLLLELLDDLVCLCAATVGVVQRRLKFNDVLFQLLLTLQSLGLGSRLRLEAGLHRFQRPSVVLTARTQTNKPASLQTSNGRTWRKLEINEAPLFFLGLPVKELRKWIKDIINNNRDGRFACAISIAVGSITCYMPCHSYGNDVRPSVHPSATFCDSIKTTQAKITKSSRQLCETL